MANLISAELLASAQSAMTDIFDTFKRSEPITVYKRERETVVIKDPNYIAGFQESNQGVTEIIKEGQSQQFDARIWYLDLQPLEGFVPGDANLQIKAKQDWGRVKIQVKEDGYLYMKDAERFYLYGERHFLDEAVRRIGILGTIQFYQFILKKVS
jgi:spermidine/putrescine-binding protein